ncbi:MAG: carbohydrate ABC transporter permease [Sphaerochaetaceae bacterium]|nr:carbohydrate ABC transporter permease [Sphaerochaetaceae bacterium]MDC7237795.1 carbohydrate ABC transporter permease [Sphaerochaetaceae bacterium]MDC7242691.1 carbohydrate ABC transporter permease [Sphaerochaetaceae bacterium]
MSNKSLKKHNRHTLYHVIMIIWCFIVLFPIYVLIINSFKTRLSIYINPFGLPKKFNLSNYTTIFKDSSFLIYFKNSFVVVILSLLLMIIFSSLAAYALAFWRKKQARLLFFFLIAGMMLPIKIASIRILEIMKFLNLLNTIWSLIPIYVAMGIPIGIFVLTEFIREIPLELTQAAIIDGAPRFKIFTLIITPLIKPALSTVAIYNLVPYWNDLWFPLIFISDEESKTLLLGVTRLFGQYQTDWSKVLAVLTLSAIPVLALYLSMSKQFIEGVTAGAVKG